MLISTMFELPRVARHHAWAFLVALLLSVAFAAPASAVVINFDTLPRGTRVTNAVLPPGFTITCTNGKVGHPNVCIIFDTDCVGGCTGEDDDLITPGQGLDNNTAQHKMMIIAEDVVDTSPADGFVDDPDDEKHGGTIVITFPQALPVTSTRVVDIEVNETQGYIRLALAAGGTTQQPILPKGNNSAQTVSFPGSPLATSMTIHLQGSGAIDDITVGSPTTTTTVGGGTTTTVGGPTTTVGGPTTTVGGGTTTTVGGPTTTVGGPTTTTILVTTTTLPPNICGNGVQEGSEECDDGAANSNTRPDACRTNCKLPFCGDGVVDSNEVCDPLEGSTEGCGTDCRLAACPLQAEICGNDLDDDGDGLIDCIDPDCPKTVKPPCGCHGILGDPAVIRFNSKKGGDLFAVHGNFQVSSPVQFDTDRFVIMLANSRGMIWRGTLVSGELKRKAGGKGRYIFRDRDARGGGPGDADNIYRVGVRLRHYNGENHVHFRIRVYGDFSLATEPQMTLQIEVGNDPAASEQTWTRTARGWILHRRDFTD